MIPTTLAATSSSNGGILYLVLAIVCILCVILMLIGLFLFIRLGSLLTRLDTREDWSGRRSRMQMVKDGANSLCQSKGRTR